MDPSTMQPMSNLLPRPPINFSRPPVLPFDLMFSFLLPHLDADKAVELQTLLDKYKRDEIPRPTIIPLMKDIVGEQLLRSAAIKVNNRKEPTKFLLAHLSKSMNAAMDHSHNTSSDVQVKSEPTYSIMDISLNS